MTTLINIQDATKIYHLKDSSGKTIENKALNHINLEIKKGETLGLVGESGSGKSTLGKAILGIEKLTSGSITYALTKEITKSTNQSMQIIFQDPYASLNPKMTALQLVMEPLEKLIDKNQAREKAIEILRAVGITEESMNKLPRAFSGGQRQRIGIARAVVAQPEFIVCDEPTSALDVSIQSQILDLLQELQKSHSLTYLFITHNLAVAEHISDRIAVLYKGTLVEIGDTKSIFTNAQHPYTKRLLQAALAVDPQKAKEQLRQQSHKVDAIVLSDQFTFEEVSSGHFVRKDM